MYWCSPTAYLQGDGPCTRWGAPEPWPVLESMSHLDFHQPACQEQDLSSVSQWHFELQASVRVRQRGGPQLFADYFPFSGIILHLPVRDLIPLWVWKYKCSYSKVRIRKDMLIAHLQDEKENWALGWCFYIKINHNVMQSIKKRKKKQQEEMKTNKIVYIVVCNGSDKSSGYFSSINTHSRMH